GEEVCLRGEGEENGGGVHGEGEGEAEGDGKIGRPTCRTKREAGPRLASHGRVVALAAPSPSGTNPLLSSHPPSLTLLLHLPAAYPSHAAPVAELARCDWLPDEERSRLCSQLDRMAGGGGGGGGGAHEGEARGGEEESLCGEVVIFQWVEWIKEQQWVWQHAPVLAEQQETEREVNSRREGGEATGETERGAAVEAAAAAEATARRGGGRRGEEGKVGDSGEEEAGEIERALGIMHGVPFTEKRSE
ncbi:unnamed protein product, partial [Closterium sp. NIES-54]